MEFSTSLRSPISGLNSTMSAQTISHFRFIFDITLHNESIFNPFFTFVPVQNRCLGSKLSTSKLIYCFFPYNFFINNSETVLGLELKSNVLIVSIFFLL